MNGNIDSRFVSRLTRETLAIVLAGGRGERLMQLTAARAKPALPFGGKFRVIDFTLSNCINSGVGRVGVLTQYKSHSLIRHLQQAWSFLRGQFGEFVEVLPAEQRQEGASWYAGTADAVYQNIEFIRTHQPRHVLILAADHIYKMDYGPMLARHSRSGAKVTVACLEVPRDEAQAFGVIQTDAEMRVLRFDEKPKNPLPVPGRSDLALASMGVYVFDAAYLLEWLSKDAGISESSHDFGKDLIPSAIGKGAVYAYPFMDMRNPQNPGYWRDVGTLDAYWKANVELAAVEPELNLYDKEWPIWTFQKQLPPAKFVFDERSRRGTAVDSLISDGCIVSGATISNSVLFSGARVEERSSIIGSLLLPDVRIGRNCRIVRSVIDEGCVIADGTVIGEDAEHDGDFFHVSKSGITLVTAEMTRECGVAAGFADSSRRTPQGPQFPGARPVRAEPRSESDVCLK